MLRTITGRILLTLGAAFAFLALIYALGAVWLPTGAVAKPDAQSRIYVLSNGFHSDIAVPVSHAEALGIRLEDYPVETDAIRYLAVGWGSVTAYTSLRAVSDLTPSIVFKAAAFDETVVHVLPLGALTARERVYAFDLTEIQLDRLVERLRADFAAFEPIADLTQGFGDLFYPGNGRFSPWRTCNSWTGAHLRAIGLPVGFWTPSAWSLEYGLKRSAQPI